MVNKHKYGGKEARSDKGPLWRFNEVETGSFNAPEADYLSRLYFPLMNTAGMKSWVSPDLKGDICASFSQYLNPPLVTEEMSKTVSSRNCWISIEGEKPWSATGMSAWQKAYKWAANPDTSQVDAQPGLFNLTRSNKDLKISTTLRVFIPSTHDKVELIIIEVENQDTKAKTLDVTYSIPLFGRHADNFRDHRQVTTMFQRVFKESHGVRIKANIVHDEHGHSPNHTSYMALGTDADGKGPEHIWLKMNDFIGEGGSLDNPEAVFKHLNAPIYHYGEADGTEAIGAFRFAKTTIQGHSKTSFIIIQGISDDDEVAEKWVERYGSEEKINAILEQTQKYWFDYTHRIRFSTADSNFDHWVKWVIYQVRARQEFGNSFLPDFSYGRGGRGWRDLWQDLLSVLLVDPISAKNEIVNNFKGIRMDGSNATIIGSEPGEFIADRNNVARSWCDHGAWPVFVVDFYMHQTGDFDILLKELPYWKDQFTHRSKGIDQEWNISQGNLQLNQEEEVYHGSVLEHMILQQLSGFYSVGEHNILQLEGADWNDTYDMARERGESIGFHAFYGNNLRLIAQWLTLLEENGLKEVSLAIEILPLLDTLISQKSLDYGQVKDKERCAFEYFNTVAHKISGEKKKVCISKLREDLEIKSKHIFAHIQDKEWKQYADDAGFYNGHYDNIGQAIDGVKKDKIQIDLTTQVMAIMQYAAPDQRVPFIMNSVQELLKEKGKKGIRLCRPFKNLDLNVGRLTGFVYGHKEHGSKWMQQNIMLAYGLYKRGFTARAYQVLDEVYQLSTHSKYSKIFPGIPSYFEPDDRGSYAWLTGSSAWMMLSLTSQMFGVRGLRGNLLLEPKLVPSQFNSKGEASIELNFRGKRLLVTYVFKPLNKMSEYVIGVISINDVPLVSTSERLSKYLISTKNLDKYCDEDLNRIKVFLQKK